MNNRALPYLHEVQHDHSRFEYRITTGPRKAWMGDPDLSEQGWEEYAKSERFDYHEERYWRRPLKGAELERAQATQQRIKQRDAIKDAERAVIEAAKACYPIPSPMPEFARLMDAIEALEAAEKKETKGENQ